MSDTKSTAKTTAAKAEAPKAKVSKANKATKGSRKAKVSRKHDKDFARKVAATRKANFGKSVALGDRNAEVAGDRKAIVKLVPTKGKIAYSDLTAKASEKDISRPSGKVRKLVERGVLRFVS